jgi:Flp pilus assembly pilin Flp
MARNAHDDRGAAAVEAGLLMAAVLLVLLPVAFALGGVVRASFTHACTAAGGCGSSGPAAQAVHGASLGGSGDTGQATQQVQQVVAEELVAQHPDAGTPAVGCPALAQPWPPAGTEITCTATYPTGETTQVRVRFTDAEGHVALAS